ncbi:alpha/beta hydrolase [Fulvivirgaceae bacterium PWU4]|uniref:Alpha/beta hydrolase n=1 Tax=Chryseosolibacter histidini TaxID=2782349 RepID=A0AAP2GKU3_9BACT|nr:alpha/beta hydrolase [Chryseosolibacter histidini]MBT1699696.1 alpha/beta hydrolase [Chryseosolibacter histidini]
MPLERIPFKTITVTSTDDFYVTPERARFFANAWKSELITLENAGHINALSSLGEWSFGLELLQKLDQQ